MSNSTDVFQEFWEKYNYVYNKQKELCILSEEYDNELCTFVQPIKEQKIHWIISRELIKIIMTVFLVKTVPMQTLKII